MLSLSHRPIGQIVLSFAAGAVLTALATAAVPVLAQAQAPSISPTPLPPIDFQQMIEWCRQMMGQGSAMVHGMMSGMCMGR